MRFHDLIIHMRAGAVEPQFIVVMMIYVIDLLFVSGRAWIALDNVTAVQVFETIKQKFTEHFTVLLTLFTFLLSLIVELSGAHANRV